VYILHVSCSFHNVDELIIKYTHPGPPQDTPGCPDTAADIPLFGHYVREAIQDMVYPVFLYPSGYSKNIKHPGYISGILFEKLTYPGHIHRIFT